MDNVTNTLLSKRMTILLWLKSKRMDCGESGHLNLKCHSTKHRRVKPNSSLSRGQLIDNLHYPPSLKHKYHSNKNNKMNRRPKIGRALNHIQL